MADRKSIFELTQDIHDSHHDKLEFISGKWFYNKIEIKDPRRYLYKLGLFKNVDELDKFIESYKVLYGKSGYWYDLPIIHEAQLLKRLAPLCYPLTQKQLKIINVLISHKEEVFFILTGVGGSGKSTFANIICRIFDNDTAALNLSDLGDDFKLATGINKRLIYSTEVNSDELNNARLKQLTSNEEITVNGKFEKPYKARCQSVFFFNCNKPPRLDLSDSGMLRRIVYLPMNEKIVNPDLSLAKREWTHEDLVNIVAHALALDMTNWREDFNEDTRSYVLRDNSVYRFRDCDTYQEYSYECTHQGLKPFSQPRWEEIRDLMAEWGVIPPLDFVKVNDSEQKEIDEIFL